MCIFHVDNVITNIVCSFYQPNKRMTFKNRRFFTFHHHFGNIRNIQKRLFFTLEKPKFLTINVTFFLSNRFARIFGNTCQSSIGKLSSAFVFTRLFVRKNSDGIGISFEIYQICPFFFCEFWL